MKPNRSLIPLASVLLGLAGTEPGAGQTPSGPRSLPPGNAGDVSATTMVFEREVFTYPAGERRNPFLAARDLSTHSPRIEDTRLLGIVHHPDSAYSLVVFGFAAGLGGLRDSPGAGPGTGRTTVRLRLGGVLGGLRVVQIHKDRVVVEADRPEGTASHVLAIPRPEEGR